MSNLRDVTDITQSKVPIRVALRQGYIMPNTKSRIHKEEMLPKSSAQLLAQWKSLTESQKHLLLPHILTWTDLWQVTYAGSLSVEEQLEEAFRHAHIPYKGNFREQRRASLQLCQNPAT